MAKKSRSGKLGGMGNTLDSDFITPMNEPKPGKDPGADVYNAPVMSPPDPLGLTGGVGGSGKGSIKGGR